jgi:hypothetical protein
LIDYKWIYEWISMTQCIIIFDEEHTEKLLIAAKEDGGKVERLRRDTGSIQKEKKDTWMNQIFFDDETQVLYVVPAPTPYSFADIMCLEDLVSLEGALIS